MPADPAECEAQPPCSREPEAAASESLRVIASDALLAGASQLAIRHRDTIYVLRQTRLGKLILTK